MNKVEFLRPHALDIPARLDEFRRMKGGWLEGEGVAPSLDGLDWLALTFERHFPDDLPFFALSLSYARRWCAGRMVYIGERNQSRSRSRYPPRCMASIGHEHQC